MSSTTTTVHTAIEATNLRALCLKNIFWTEGGFTVGAVNARLFGVADSEGRMLSFDGVSPSGFATKQIAMMIASGGLLAPSTWITVKTNR